jgi:type I restriction enzyme S subunit
MDSKTFFENFETIADAPGGIARLRELILDFAIRGLLTQQMAEEEPHPVKKVDGPFDVPSNWRWANLEMIADYGGRGNVTPNAIKNEDWILDLEDIEKSSSRLTQKVVASDRKTTSNKAVFEAGDVLYGKLRPYLDKVIVADESGFCTTEIVPITPAAGIDSHWLRISLKSPHFLRFVTDKSYGMKMPRLGTKDAKASLHAVPPYVEQKRIVAKVNELMSLCDDLEAAQNQRGSIRTAVRKSAIDSISTATTPDELNIAWKRISNNWTTFSGDLDGISSLRQLILDLLMSDNSVGNESQESNWAIKKFGDLGDCRLGKMLDKAKNTGELHPYLRNTNVQWFRIDKSDIAEMRVSTNEVDEFTLKADDLLICEGGQPGRCSIVSAAEEGLLFQKALHRFRPNQSTDVKFVAYSLMRASMNGTLERLFTGVTIKHLTGQSLKSFEIALPSVIEQRLIAAKVDKLMALCDELEASLRERNELTSKIASSLAKEIAA